MGRLLYFFPNLNSLDGLDDDLKERCALSRVLDVAGDLDHGKVTGAGPSGGPGIIAAVPGNPGRIGYYPKEQTWTECAEGQFWLGWEGEQPTSDMLLRKDAPPHLYDVTLGDGNKWRTPTARVFGGSGESPIPHRIFLDRKGEEVLKVLPKFQCLMDYATKAVAIIDAALEAGLVGFSMEREFVKAANVECLTAMYRIGKWEAGALGLFRNDEPYLILAALVDLPGRERMVAAMNEAAKKNDRAVTDAT